MYQINMIEIKLEDIIINKSFGPIKLRTTKDKVLELLGKPDGVGNPEIFPEDYESFVYDWFEFTFFKGCLERFHYKYILTSEYKFNIDFNYQNENFRVTHWFKNHKEDLKLNSIKKWLKEKEIVFKEEPFYDCMRILIDNQLELQFHSKIAYHKDYKEWQKISSEELNWQLGAFYLHKD